MEGPASLKERIAIVIILLFHAVGLAGLMIPAFRAAFLSVVPFHLLLMFVVVLFNHNYISFKFLGFVLLTYLLAFCAEWVGVHQEWLFGKYSYGKTLGVKVWQVPLTIGLNWFMLIYSAGVSMRQLGINKWWLRIPAGALALVLLDVLIEPVAIRFDYWHWSTPEVPFGNYLGWFGASVVMLSLFEIFQFGRQNRAPLVLLIVQFVFFALLANIDVAM